MIANIKITKLHPHYDNPRKDLGDLTELADSIKANGILQNLTVIPWFSQITGVGADDPNQQEEMGYIVIIGHRRLAAAKLAGLEEVPCVITNMTPKEQLATMLLENMQRSDLTVYEEAQGFQMMLDLGESVKEISKKTGFSETTIRKRTKLLELDQEKFKSSVERGATLMDYVELEKIKDIELRNNVLEYIGTTNFNWQLQSAIKKEESDANKAFVISELEKFATQIEDISGLQYVKVYYSSQKPIVERPDDSDSVKYFFNVSEHNNNYISLYKKSENISNISENKSENKSDNVNLEYEEKRKKQREKRDELDKLSDQAYKLRYDYVRNISNTVAKKSIGTIVESLLWTIIFDCGNYFELEKYAEFFDIKLIDELNYEENNEEEDNEEDIDVLNFNIVKKHIKTKPETHLLVSAYLMLDSKNENYYDLRNDYFDNNTLNTVYDLLEKIGYRKSDEEQSLCDGTHTLFQDLEDIIMMKAIENLKKAMEMDEFNSDLPQLEVGKNYTLAEVWDGESETPTDSYSYRLTDIDWINYKFEMIEEKENVLENIIKIVDIELI